MGVVVLRAREPLLLIIVHLRLRRLRRRVHLIPPRRALVALATFSELHTDMVDALVALPDNQHALSGSYDKTVKLFNVNHGAVLRTVKHHTASVRCLALLPDGLRFVSGSDDHTARIVEIGRL